MRAWVPVLSPYLALAAAQYRSWVAVNTPAFRACTSAVADGSAPGL